MPPYETRILDPSEYDDTELGSEVRAAWAEGVRVIELVEPRTLVVLRRPCPNCGGRGYTVLTSAGRYVSDDPNTGWMNATTESCKTCHGSGVVRRFLDADS